MKRGHTCYRGEPHVFEGYRAAFRNEVCAWFHLTIIKQQQKKIGEKKAMVQKISRDREHGKFNISPLLLQVQTLHVFNT